VTRHPNALKISAFAFKTQTSDFPIGFITSQKVTLQTDADDELNNTKIAHMVGIHKSTAYQVWELLRKYVDWVEDVLPETREKGFVSKRFVSYVRDVIAKDCKYLFVSPTNGFERTLQNHYGFVECGPGHQISMDGGKTWKNQPKRYPDLVDNHKLDYFTKELNMRFRRIGSWKQVMLRPAGENEVYNAFIQAYSQDPRLNGGLLVLELEPQQEKRIKATTQALIEANH